MLGAIAIGFTLAGLVDFGSNARWTRDISNGALFAPIGAQMSSKIGLALLVAGLMAALDSFLAGETGRIAGSVFVATLLGQTMQVVPRARLMVWRVGAIQLLERLLALAVMEFLLAGSMTGEDSLWIALAVGSSCAAIAGWRWHPYDMRPNLPKRWTGSPWRGSGGFGFGSIAVSAQQLDVPLLDLTAGPAAAGVYGAVRRWTQPITVPVAAFTSAALPRFARADSVKSALSQSRSGWWLLGLSVGGAITVAALAPLLVSVLLGEQYSDSSAVLAVLALATIPVVLNQPLAVLLQSRGREAFVAKVLVGTVATQLATLAIAGHAMGSLGASISVLGMQLVLLVLLAHRVVRMVRSEA